MWPGPWLAGAVACHHHLVTVDRVRLVTVFLALERGTMIFVGHKVGNLSHKTFCGSLMNLKTHHILRLCSGVLDNTALRRDPLAGLSSLNMPSFFNKLSIRWAVGLGMAPGGANGDSN